MTCKHIAVFGAGIAGLTVAHELVRRGHQVTVYEASSQPGGFFVSRRHPTYGTPEEYSWHGMGPWYHNTYDIMKQIPLNDTQTVYSGSLSRPINYAIASDDTEDELQFDKPDAFHMTWWDKVVLGWSLLLVWTSDRRAKEHYSHQNAYEVVRPWMSERGGHTWRSCFGPWIGPDWTRTSYTSVGRFFEHNLWSGQSHDHHDMQGSWQHGPGDGWLVLKGPSNEYWFDPWVRYLESQGVIFHFNTKLESLVAKDNFITHAMADGQPVVVDEYVLAIDPFSLPAILDQSILPEDEQLNQCRRLATQSPHVQVSFRIAWCDAFPWPRERTVLVLSDSEYNITLCDVVQVWDPSVNLGNPRIKSLWTCTACASTVPGRVYGLPVDQCTKAQFIDEIRAQVMGCATLNRMIRDHDGKSMSDYHLEDIEVWHEWLFNPEGISSPRPKWVYSTATEMYLPTNQTSIPNLHLAGAHTLTEAAVWSIEAAVESGRRCSHHMEKTVSIMEQFKLWIYHLLSQVDNVVYTVGLPHLLNILLAIVIVFVSLYIYRSLS